MTLDEFYYIWIEAIRETVKANTIRTYSCAYKNHIADPLGKSQLCDINYSDIIKLRSLISKNVSDTYKNYVITVLKIIMEEAVRHGLADRNPARNIRSIKVIQHTSDTAHRALTTREQRVFMDHIKGQEYYNLIAFLLCSGMRFGEAGALRWCDIDFDREIVMITRTISYDENCHITVNDTPKSRSAIRNIPVNSSIFSILSSQKAITHGLTTDRNPESLVFLSSKNSFIENRSVNRFISKAVTEINADGFEMEKFTCHALRDTFATRYIEQGGSMQTLKTILGHSSITLTMDLYSHVLPDTRKKEMDMIKIDI